MATLSGMAGGDDGGKLARPIMAALTSMAGQQGLRGSRLGVELCGAALQQCIIATPDSAPREPVLALTVAELHAAMALASTASAVPSTGSSITAPAPAPAPAPAEAGSLSNGNGKAKTQSPNTGTGVG